MTREMVAAYVETLLEQMTGNEKKSSRIRTATTRFGLATPAIT